MVNYKTIDGVRYSVITTHSNHGYRTTIYRYTGEKKKDVIFLNGVPFWRDSPERIEVESIYTRSSNFHSYVVEHFNEILNDGFDESEFNLDAEDKDDYISDFINIYYDFNDD